MAEETSTPPPTTSPPTLNTTLSHRPANRASNLSLRNRRKPGGSPLTIVRNVTFRDDPVTMRQSPNRDEGDSSSAESTPKRGRTEWRSTTPDITITASTNDGNLRDSRSVKHLTCFWWKEKGSCKYTDDQCLYAHEDTGRYTDAPRQLNPDEPAKAGRNLARALSNLSLNNQRASSPGGGAHGARSLTPTGSTISRSSAPTGAYGARPTTPSLLSRSVSPPSHNDEIMALQREHQFYRDLVMSNQQEKGLLIEMIYGLKDEVAGLKEDVARYKSDNLDLLSHKEVLTAQLGSVLRARTNGNPYGAIGSSPPPGLGHGMNIQAPASAPAWRTVSASAAVGRATSPTGSNPSEDGDETTFTGRGQGY